MGVLKVLDVTLRDGGCVNNFNFGHNYMEKILAAQRNIAGYLKAKEFAEENNVKIYNATRGGALEIFERVNLDDILS